MNSKDISVKSEIEEIIEDSSYEEDNNDSLSEYSEESSIVESIDEENKEEEGDKQVKKKRGRKSKPKDESNEVEKVQKKRGRKPKIKDESVNEKIPKKRGRKPKEKIYSVKELPKTFFEENKNETLILHLPIKLNDKDINNQPQPNINNIQYSIYNEDINNYKINDKNLLLTQQNLLDNLVFDNEINDIDEINDKNNIINQNIRLNKNDTDQYNKSNEDEIKTNKIIKKNLRNIMYEFINSNNDKSWPDSTNTYCWWCCHPFNGPPCALPELYKKEKFYVSGCYCSFNCAASYNFSKNEDVMWERYSLLNLMYKKLYNQKFVKINLAPPREILKIFGGYLTIDEFRDNSLKNDKIFSVIKPPLISIIPKIEENISNTNKNIKNSFPTVNENILNKTQNNLKLKRNKPITNPNSTLQSFMDLKII